MTVSKKKDLFFVEATELVKGIDFEVRTDTPFNEELVTHFFEFENHAIDYELALTLGLGVIKNLHFEDDFYIYNASNDNVDNFGIAKEFTRISVYYQITHPQYDNKKLEEFIETERGRSFLKKLQTNDSDVPYVRLKQLFNNKKGNIIPFSRNV